MAQQAPKVSAEAARREEMIRTARNLPTDRGVASCVAYPDLYGRVAVALRPDPDDQEAASAICAKCPLLRLCPVAVTKPGD